MNTTTTRYRIPLDRLFDNPWQTRQLNPDKVASLAEDIRATGLLQPPVGRMVNREGQGIRLDEIFTSDTIAELKASDVIVQIAFGHHRLGAFRKLHQDLPDDDRWSAFPVELQDLSDEQMALYGWAENEHRGDLNTVEKALAIQRYVTDFGWTQDQVAKKLGLDRSTVANKLRLLKLPEEAIDALRVGTISERQALPLLALVDLPQDAREYAEHLEYNYSKPSQVLKNALTGKSSSDEVRRSVESAIERATVDMSSCKFLSEPFEGGGYFSSICKSCKHYVSGQNRCQSPGCFQRKQTAWRTAQARVAVDKTGIPIADPGDSSDYKCFWGDERALILGVLADKICPNMRLKESPYGSGTIPNGVDGYELICQHGKGKRCTCLAAAAKKHNANDPEEIARRQAIKDVEAAEKEATQLLVEALSESNQGAWYLLWKRYCSYSDEKKLDTNTPVALIQAALARQIVNYAIKYDMQENPEKARKALGEVLASCGQQATWMPPKVSPAEDAWSRYLRIADWVKDLSHELPTTEMVRGNIVNLERLIDVPGLETEQWEAMTRTRDLLEQIKPILEGWTVEDTFRHVSALVTVPSGDCNFTSALEQASAKVIEYALCFIPEKDNKVKRAMLNKRLAKLKQSIIDFSDKV